MIVSLLQSMLTTRSSLIINYIICVLLMITEVAAFKRREGQMNNIIVYRSKNGHVALTGKHMIRYRHENNL